MILKETVGGREAGKRLDEAAALLFPGLSRSRVRKIIDLGGCAVNGVMCRVASRALKEGDEVTVGVMEPGRFRELVLGGEDIMYQDGEVLAVRKPAGFSSQRTPYQLKGTVEYAVGVCLKAQGIDGPVRIVHRLDRGTSGVMLFPKSREAAAMLSGQLKEGTVGKVYLALVGGTPQQERWEVDAPIAKVASSRYGVATPGKEARTGFRVLARGEGAALVEARPFTGRTHQIRVHLAHCGLPIVGDPTYGGAGAPRLMLHCCSMTYRDREGREVAVTAGPDGEFAEICREFAINVFDVDDNFEF